jgi:hypothetical protein
MKLFSSFSLLVGSNAMDIGDLKKFLLLRQNMDQYKGGQGDPANMSNFLTQVNSINNDKGRVHIDDSFSIDDSFTMTHTSD